jgi:hypothetical protein
MPTKKSTTKPAAVPPAPPAKAVPPAKKSAPKKAPAAVPAAAPVAVAKPAPVATPAPAATSEPAPVKKAPAKLPALKTTIIAKIDVGWGNSLYLRGQGGGLSWDVGVLLECAKDDEWTWSTPASGGPITFKFVRNDQHWALGDDQVVLAGETSVSTPEFPPW